MMFLLISSAWANHFIDALIPICIVVVFLEPVIFPWDIFRKYHVLSYFTIAVMAIMTLWSGIDYLRTYWKFLDPEK